MKKTKRIALFISGEQNFKGNMCKNVIEYGNRLGYQVHIYSISGAFQNNILCAVGEKNILNLPDYTQLDGIILVTDALDIPHMREEMYERFAKYDCPVVSIRGNGEAQYNVLLENKATIREIVRHFVEIHHFTDICYVGGRREMEDATQRYESFVETMERYGLSVSEATTYHGNFWYSCAGEALDHFMKDREPGHYPQAIICANDYMALGMQTELEKRGVRVPQDVCVSGFDDVEEAGDSFPSLTSIKVPFEKMAEEAVRVIDNVIKGIPQEKNIYVTGELVLRESCGCRKHSDYKKRIRVLNNKLDRQIRVSEQIHFMSLEFEEAIEEADIFRVLARYADNNVGFKRMYICLCDEEERKYEEVEMYDKYTEDMILMTIVHPKGNFAMPNQKFKRSELLPKEYMDEEKFLYIFPMHYKNHCLGYLAVSYHEINTFDNFMRSWTLHLVHMLNTFYNSRKLKVLGDMRRLAFYDELTGLFNRRAFAQYTRAYVIKAVQQQCPMCVVSIDMDKLKYINDTYGHAEGDYAIQAIAQCLQAATAYGEVCCRIGGDEFAVCAVNYSKGDLKHFLEQFESHLAELNASSGKSYQISASVGYCIAVPSREDDLMEMIHISDMNMYENKKKRGLRREE